MRRKRQKQAKTRDIHAETFELEAQDRDAKRKWYLGGRWRSEADAPRKIEELDALRKAGELDAPHKVGELDSRAVRVVPGPPAELEAGPTKQEW